MTGTEKQIVLAEKIRKEFMVRYERYCEENIEQANRVMLAHPERKAQIEESLEESKEQMQKIREYFIGQTEASYWIETRGVLAKDIIRKAIIDLGIRKNA